MLDPTQRESDLFSSVKKHMIDSLSLLNIPVFFEYLPAPPVDSNGAIYTKWCCCILGDREFGTVGEAELFLVLFTRDDSEGDDLAALSDSVLGCFIDPTSLNGMRLITYYNTITLPWVAVGGILPFVGACSKRHKGRDLTKYKTIPVTLKWGSK